MVTSKSKNKNRLRALGVRRLTVERHIGFWALSAGPVRFRCAVGRHGATRQKREGDGLSPIGAFPIIGWYKNRKWQGPAPFLFQTINKNMGWCDDISSGAYNRPIRFPFRASAETLERADGKYDVVGVMDYNVSRIARGAGSAIFLHITDDFYGPTAGCVALRRGDMRKLLGQIAPRPIVVIKG